VDETGRLLADGAGGNDATGAGADERQAAYERRLREQVEAIVSSVVGPGHARVQLTADFDFNRVTQTSEKYDPEGRVMRSSQTREESSAANEGKDGQVTVGNELPNAQRGGDGGTAAPREQSRKSEEIVNYEISRSTKTEVTEGGRVNRVSVAVLVDGIYGKNDKGEVAYQPREKEEIDRIAALVRTAIGFDQKRGDQVEVVNLRFAESPINAIPEPTGFMSLLQFTKDDIMHWIEMFVMLVLGLVVLLLVVRPLVRRILAPDQPVPPQVAIAAAIAGGDVHGAIAAGATANDIKGVPSQTSKMIDIAQVQGQVHAQSVQKVGELADKNPTETISIIRSWLHEKAA
jgi:flagellar M-ring protein FliF